MLRQLLWLYRRYTAAQLRLAGRPSAILGSDGRGIGNIDEVTLIRGRLRVAGWVHAARASLVHDGMEVRTVPRHRREDVAQARNVPAEVGFELDLSVDASTLSKANPPTLICEAVDERTSIRPVPLILHNIRAKRLIGMVAFGWAVICLVPAIVGWYSTHDPIYRARVKARLGLNQVFGTGEIDTRLYADAADAPEAMPPPRPARITIVLPVYNAFDLLEPVLARLEAHTDLPWRLILIEDASSDARVRPFLRDWTTAHTDTCDITLIENGENEGFIRSVNSGLAHAMQHTTPDDGPVILLNSDAFVPQGWASRLVRAMMLDAEIASATPMSNDAEIFSVPAICHKTPLRDGQADRIDAVARGFHMDALQADVPTGVGFCMAMSRRWLERVPALDTAFGRGYGEEVDWCQKVARSGGRHVAVPNLFVEHRGGESFGSADKLALVAKNNEIVSQRYPDYDTDVQSFIRSDPLLTPRLALGLAWAGSLDHGRATPVYLAHSLGGGAETYLEGQIEASLADGVPVVVLRVGGMARWQIELHTSFGMTGARTDDTNLMRRLIGHLTRRHIIYSCGVGDTNPVALPQDLAALATGADDIIEVLFHDFYPLSASYTLLESDGVFRGPPDMGNDDKAHQGVGADGTPVSLRDWQAAWRTLAKKATTLRVFSQDSARHVCAVWPDLAALVVVSPHALPFVPPVLPRPAVDAPTVIGVLGNIGFQKGAAVVQELALQLNQHRSIRMVLIGNIDPRYGLPKSVKVHGDYRPSDIADLAVHYRVTHWLIPSIWPETFSYTTQEALATGRPVLAFDIGAQGDAVAAAQNGIAVPLPREVHPNGTAIRGASGRAARNLIETIEIQDYGQTQTRVAEKTNKTVARTDS